MLFIVFIYLSDICGIKIIFKLVDFYIEINFQKLMQVNVHNATILTIREQII